MEEGLATLQGSGSDPTLDAYTKYYTKLLWAEEAQMERDLSQYNLCGRRSTRLETSPKDQLLWLELPGLAERRPSVMRGDFVETPSTTSGAYSSDGGGGEGWRGDLKYLD